MHIYSHLHIHKMTSKFKIYLASLNNIYDLQTQMSNSTSPLRYLISLLKCLTCISNLLKLNS